MAAAVRARRGELRLTRQQLVTKAENAGLDFSGSWLALVESGKKDRFRSATLEELDVALDWAAGTCLSILEGQVTPSEARKLSDHLPAIDRDRLVSIAVPAQKLTDAEALIVVLGCLNDDQYSMFARAVQADERFASL